MASSKASLLESIKQEGRVGLAHALSMLEEAPESDKALVLLTEAWRVQKAHNIGLTGTPGVGKSTLAGALVREWRGQGKTVGVLAVDPSSRLTGGALLGDRARIVSQTDDDGVFVRSMAAGRHPGGLAETTTAAATLMGAFFDKVVVESVGVGQSESDIADMSDTLVLCIQPGAGDKLQFMKAGIMELSHIIAVTKSDMGDVAHHALSDVAVHMGQAVGPFSVSAQHGEGVDALAEVIDAHYSDLVSSNQLVSLRHVQACRRLEVTIKVRFGEEALKKAGALLALEEGHSPFSAMAHIMRKMEA
ncbi:MAG: hypothetical protein V6Z81_01515 [Parvularculales bacterium]